MKKKIIGMFVCVLLIAAIIPTVESIKNSTINTTVPSAPQRSMVANWTEIQKLIANDGAAQNNFGFSVSFSGDTALIGAYGDDDNGALSGSAYVFTRSGTTWTQQAKLKASDGATWDWFGHSVSLDGNTALIGAHLDDDNGDGSGSAYVFTRSGTTWTQQAKLTASNGAAFEEFGWAVSLSGDNALIGAPGYGGDSNRGSAYVFTWDGTTWTQVQKLIGSADYLNFGYSVSIDHNTALIGADRENSYRGSAYVYIRPGVDWMLQQKLTASDGVAPDRFGCSVSLSGDTALIGAEDEYDSLYLSGSAYVFTRSGTTWTQQTKLTAADASAGDYFGFSVSLDGDTASIGAVSGGDNEVDSGSAYMFTRSSTTWTQQAELLPSDGATNDRFGCSVSLDGDTVLIGAYFDDDNGDNSGSVYVFTKEGGTPGLTFDITGGLGINLKITNNGTPKSTSIDWQINVNGGMLGKISKTSNGTIDVPAGESRSVGTGLFFGLGLISITAKVADEEKTAEGIQIIIFSIVK